MDRHPPADAPSVLVPIEQRWNLLLANLAAGVLELDREERFVYANPAAMRLFGLELRDTIGRTVDELGVERYDLQGNLVLSSAAPLRHVLERRETVHAVLRYVRAPHLDVWLESQTAPLFSATGELTGSVSTFVDVTDRFRLEAAERAATTRMTEVLRAMPTGVVLVDADGRIEYANDAAAAVSGVRKEDIVGELIADPAWQLTDASGKVLPYDALPVPTALRERRPVQGVELGVPTMTGLRWMMVHAHPVFHADGALRGAVVTTEDVTERRALNEQLLHAQKLEGIGALAGGIAHDFNNLLTIILGNAELVLTETADGSPAATCVREIGDAARRGTALTRQLLLFARKELAQPRAVDVGQLTASLEPLLRRALGEVVRLQRSSASKLWSVRIDPGQLEQVIMNMVINGRDAMPNGGTVTLRCDNCVIGAQDSTRDPACAPGDYVRISIGDTGTGILPDVLSRIYEPFFTTKPIGSGSGLGLSICHGVIRRAGGFIVVETAPERGTTFHVHLPRSAESVAETNDAGEGTMARGQGTILLVDDDEAVRRLVARALDSYGYDVISAASADEAMRCHAALDRPLDLLVTDIVMPHTDGHELARALHARVPDVPVLFMTGYFDALAPGAGEMDVAKNLLLKPFTPMQLVARVRQLLAQ